MAEEPTIEELQERVKRLEDDNKKWMRLAGMNRLTELPNSLMMYKVVLPVELRKEYADSVAFSCVMLCPDELGEVNQDHGRNVGDLLIQKIGSFIKDQLEPEEQLFHCDGANFAIVIPRTPEGRARRRATLIKNQIKQQNFDIGGAKFKSISCSAGASEVESGVEPGKINKRLENLYDERCNRLYDAKKLGGDTGRRIAARLMSRRHKIRRQATSICAMLAAFLLSSSSAGAESFERAHLETIEDYSESLANQLHDLSLAVRDRNLEHFASQFAEDFAGFGWTFPGAALPEIKWVSRREGIADSTALDRAGFVRHFDSFIKQFTSIEDVRFKVKGADFAMARDPVEVDATIYFSIVGRDRDGRREWIEAKAHIQGRSSAGKWEIFDFKPTEVIDRVSQVELFSEVSLSAGVYQAQPPFGTPGNQVFVAHGVAVADVDGDGLVDAFASGAGENYLYMNNGDGSFTNSAAEAGLAFTPMATGPLFVDVDQDGDQDLFLAAVGHQMLFENSRYADGEQTFIDVSQQAGVSYPAQGFSAVSADINRDGWPDIYVASYNQYGTIMPNSWSNATNGTPNLLFVNGGDGRFREEAAARGVADRRWSYAAHFGDMNGDGQQDLYVANDFGENGLFINEGGKFQDRAAGLRVLDPGNGMGVSMGDYNNDGLLDLYVTNMSSTAGNRIIKRLFPDEATRLDQSRVLSKLAAGNTLFENLGGGQFRDVSADVGPFSAGWAFGGGFVDLDNDGWEDLHAPNGFISGKSLKDT